MKTNFDFDMDMKITRRDFLNGVLIGTGAFLLNLPAPIKLMAQTEDWEGVEDKQSGMNSL